MSKTSFRILSRTGRAFGAGYQFAVAVCRQGGLGPVAGGSDCGGESREQYLFHFRQGRSSLRLG